MVSGSFSTRMSSFDGLEDYERFIRGSHQRQRRLLHYGSQTSRLIADTFTGHLKVLVLPASGKVRLRGHGGFLTEFINRGE